MKLLLDTHLLLWTASEPERLSPLALEYINNEENELFFSAASFWEIAIKNSLGRKDFFVDSHLLKSMLLDNDYQEIPILSQHTIFISHLEPIHKDPFDRILISQAITEGMCLLTTDNMIAKYNGSIRLV